MITVAGCGRMGLPMLSALRNAGFEAQGFDVVETPNDFVTSDINTLRAKTKILITVVRDIAQTDEVLFTDQAFANAPNLQCILICSTLSPRYVTALRHQIPTSVTLIDAPMSGAQIAAEEARLSFMLGGEDTEIAKVQPLLNAMGRHIHHMGSYGAGMQAKVLNNLLAASNTAMTRLVLDWADDTGLDTTKLLNLIHTSSGQNWLASGFDDIEFARDGYQDDNTIGILVKDVASALDAAPNKADLSLPKTLQQNLRSLTPRLHKSSS